MAKGLYAPLLDGPGSGSARDGEHWMLAALPEQAWLLAFLGILPGTQEAPRISRLLRVSVALFIFPGMLVNPVVFGFDNFVVVLTNQFMMAIPPFAWYMCRSLARSPTAVLPVSVEELLQTRAVRWCGFGVIAITLLTEVIQVSLWTDLLFNSDTAQVTGAWLYLAWAAGVIYSLYYSVLVDLGVGMLVTWAMAHALALCKLRKRIALAPLESGEPLGKGGDSEETPIELWSQFRDFERSLDRLRAVCTPMLLAMFVCSTLSVITNVYQMTRSEDLVWVTIYPNVHLIDITFIGLLAVAYVAHVGDGVAEAVRERLAEDDERAAAWARFLRYTMSAPVGFRLLGRRADFNNIAQIVYVAASVVSLALQSIGSSR